MIIHNTHGLSGYIEYETTEVTDKEFNLIKAMRSIDSQDGKYEVNIFVRNYPDRYLTCEYSDEFEITNQYNEIEVSDLIKLRYQTQIGYYHELEEMSDTNQIKYRCPECGKVITHDELMDEINSGSMGMCYCEYTQTNRILNQFIKIGENE